jgi:Carboxypeptidase regulatory-like domain/TonB-dependent Receptor Plug Domain
MKKILLIALALIQMQFVFAQDNLQNIKGTIIDKQSQSNLINVDVSVMVNDVEVKATSTENGNYALLNIPPGRYELKANRTGYKEVIIPNIIVASGKETIIDIAMEEKLKNKLNGVMVTSKAGNKQKTINDLATISARTFSTEEVNRYAGGRSDPARLAANFAGVSSPNDSRNDIVIRGNSPTGVLWRIEGMNVPNPNHFATIGTTGGPVAALNTNMLKNSDFFTSAFPAEYGNANAGVFDIGFRKGNADKREHTLQIGALTGIEAMTEGPIKKGNGSSYVIGYRYSFTGVAQQLGIPIGTAATPFYQDISFKFTSGQSKYGRFTWFGLGGRSDIKFLHNKIDSTDLFADPTSDSYFKSRLGMTGVKHFIKINEKSFINTVVGATFSSSEYLLDTLETITKIPARVTENIPQRLVYNINSSYNTKMNARLFIKAGIMADVMQLNLNYRTRFKKTDWQQLWDFNDATTLLQAYTHAKYNVNEKMVVNIGAHAQYLTLNNSTSVEPRIGIKYNATNKSSFSIGYGLHSQMQSMDVYFYRQLQADGSYDKTNQDLDFTRSHHFVIGYDYLPAKDWRIKTEMYYQSIFDVPVTIAPSSFSMLNNGSSFNPTNKGYLNNNGTGTNYGIELTVEKFFSKGYYGLLTGTLYDSKYKGSNGVEHNTGFNGKYVANVLVGKEFVLDAKKRNAFTADIKVTTAGGRFYTPVDIAKSQQQNTQVEKGDAFAFSERNKDFFRLDCKVGFMHNSKKRKISQSLFFDIQNVTNNKNVFAERYNTVTQKVNASYQIGLFPNFIYKVQF